MENILVSACLLGMACRYDGKSKADDGVIGLMDRYNLIPICPEIYGGLETPRNPAEIINGSVMTENGADVTDSYEKGAKEALRLAKLFGCTKAVLKEKSPSCGFGSVYDGTFSRNIISGNGIAADLLYNNGITIFGESNLHFLA